MAHHPDHAKWIEGEKQPTTKQLLEFSKNVHVPYGFLFLEKLPEEKMPIPLFRRHVHKDAFNLDLYDTITTLQDRQDWLTTYLIEGDYTLCKCVGSISLATPIEEVIALMCQILDLDEGWNMRLRDEESAVRVLTERIENLGIVVSFNGVVGNNTHRPLTTDQCRGFALVNKEVPFIFINNSDAKKAQLFTLAHELCHVLLGVSAGAGGNETSLFNDAIEKYCDKVAASFLVPKNLLLGIWSNVSEMAKRFRVSEIMMARRAYSLGLIDKDELNMWFAISKTHKKSKNNNPGGDFFRTTLKRVGRLFAIYVRNAVEENRLSYTEAFSLVDVHGKSYDKLMKLL